MDVIQNITAIRRSGPSERWVDIDFNVTEPNLSQIVGYEAYVIPAHGRIRKRYFSSETPQSSQRLTMKYLRKDMSYTFKFHAVYSDDTISNDAETAIVHGSRSGQVESSLSSYMVVNRGPSAGGQDHQVRRTLPEFVSDIRIGPKNIYDREDILIAWDHPKIEDTCAYEIRGFRVELSGPKKVIVAKAKSEDTSCTVMAESTETYKVDVKMMYWDVDSDCMREVAANPIHHTTGPRNVNPRKIKHKWIGNTLSLKWRNVAGATSYEWEICNQDTVRMGGGSTKNHECTWTCHDNCTSYEFKFQIKSVTVKKGKKFASETVTKDIPARRNATGTISERSNSSEKVIALSDFCISDKSQKNINTGAQSL